MMTIMWYFAGAVVLALAVVLFKMWDLDRKRRADREGITVMQKHQFFFGNARNILNLGKSGGDVYEYLLKGSVDNDFRPWIWSTPVHSTLIVSDPEDLRHAFHKNAENYNHGNRKARFQDLFGDGIFNSDGEVWKEQRRIASHMFTKKQLDGMVQVFERNTEKVMAQLRQHVGTSFDVQKLLYCYTFDSINEVAFGRFAASLDGNEEALRFQAAFDTSQMMINTRFVNPLWKIQKMLGYGLEGELPKHLGFIHKVLDQVLEEKLANKEAMEVDLVAMHIQKCESEGVPYTRQQLKDVIINNMVAGRDTTGSISSSMLIELSKHPAVLDKVRKEVSEHGADVEAMQYLQAVFQETLRLHLSVPLDAKTAAEDDMLPSGTLVRKGVQLGFHPYIFNRNPKIYEEPYEFKPERWMKDGACEQYDQWTFPAFNLGPRICLGRHMAAREAKTVIAAIVSEYDFTLDEEPLHGFQPVLYYRNGVNMTFTPRN